jgi:hypothetical protein
MDSKWVLTNEEKRVRFKNFFKKKDEAAMAPAVAGRTAAEESRDQCYITFYVPNL